MCVCVYAVAVSTAAWASPRGLARWAKRESALTDCAGFVHFYMLRRDAGKADDGFNFASCTVWKDRAAFNGASERPQHVQWRVCVQSTSSRGAVERLRRQTESRVVCAKREEVSKGERLLSFSVVGEATQRCKESRSHGGLGLRRRSISGRPDGASLSKRLRWVVAGWRESQKFKNSHGGGPPAAAASGAADAAEKPKGPPPGAMGMMLEPPSVALFEGKLMLAAQ